MNVSGATESAEPLGAAVKGSFLLLSEDTCRSLMARIESNEYLGTYWKETVLPGLEAELAKPGSAVRLAFAWRLTGNEAYAHAAWKAMTAGLLNKPSNILHTGGRIIELVTALSWLKDSPGSERETIEQAEALLAELIDVMFDFFHMMPYGQLEVNRGENWDSQMIASLGIGASYIENHPKHSQWLEQAKRAATAWLARRRGDGGLCEGTINYHLYALSNMTRLGDVLREYGLADLFADAGLRKMFEFYVHTLAPDGRVVGFNDSERCNLHKRNGTDLLLLKGALEYGDPMYMWAYRRVREDLPDYYECFPHLLLYYPDDDRAAPPEKPGSMVFPNVGWVSMRNGWGRDDTHMVLKAGPWGGWHDHLDSSTFELVSKGVPLAVDAGCGSYSDRMDWFRRTEAHNVVMLDGCDQFPGDGHVVRFWSSDVADYAVVDSRRALKGSDGRTVRGSLRHVFYDKRNDCFMFLDSISGAKECQWLLHSRGEMSVGQQQAVWTTPEGVRLSARFLAPQVEIAAKTGRASMVEDFSGGSDVEYISATPAESLKPAEWKPGRSADMDFAVLLEPLSPDEKPAEVEVIDAEAGYYTLRRPGRTTHVKVMLGGRKDCSGELEFTGLAALVDVHERVLTGLALVGAKKASLAGKLLFESEAPADISLEGFENGSPAGKLHVWGELTEEPILVCDGEAASILHERSSAGSVEVEVGVPGEPTEVLLGGNPVQFRYDGDRGSVRFEVQSIGEDLSLAICSK